MKRFSELALLLFIVSCFTSCFPEEPAKAKIKIIDIWEAQKVEISYYLGGEYFNDIYTEKKDWDEANMHPSTMGVSTPYAFVLFSNGKYDTFDRPVWFEDFMEDPEVTYAPLASYKIEGGQFCRGIGYGGSIERYDPEYNIITNNEDSVVLEVINEAFLGTGVPVDAKEIKYKYIATFKKRKDF